MPHPASCSLMHATRALALVCLLAGLALGAYGIATGDVRVGFFLIVPFVIGTGFIALAAMGLLFAAVVLWVIGAQRGPSFEDAQEPRVPEPGGESRTKTGGVVLIGPIPIVWGSDRRILAWMIAAGVVLLALALLIQVL